MQEQSVKNQYFAAIVVAMLAINYGTILGWPSPSIILLRSDKSPLPTGKITLEEVAWITSLLAIGGIIGNLVFGYSMNKIGRKWTLILLAVPAIINWLLILFAQNVYYLYLARIVSGLVPGGLHVAAPVYMSEISTDRIRGTLVSVVGVCGHVGIEIAFALGAFCSYSTTPVFSIALMIVFVVSFTFLPETPIFCVKQNRIAEAEKSIRFFRSIEEKDIHIVHLEIERLKIAINDSATKQSNKQSLKWKDFATRSGRRAMMIGSVVSSLVQLSGGFIIISYAAHIFEESRSALSPNISAIIVGLLRICGSSTMMLLVDRTGRKLLYMISTIGATLGYIFVGVYILLKSWDYEVEALNWIPIFGLSSIIFIESLAISTLAFTVVAEIMPEELKDFGITFCHTLLSVCSFFALNLFPLLIDTESFGLHGCMFLFAGICLSCGVFIIRFMPETKGRSYEEIMKLL